MSSSSIETQPLTPQPVNVWDYTDDPAVVRILAAQYRQRRIVLGAFVVALVFAVLAYVTGIMPLLGVAAAALLVAVVGWALWFTRWE